MPSLTISAALLVLGEHDAQPWRSLTWQGHTGTPGVPWETPAGASPDDPAPNVDGWTVRTAQTVKTYAENLWSKSTLARIQYSTRGYTDNDAEGRAAWNAFVQTGIRNWEFNKTVDNVLKDCKLTPYDAMARAKSKTLPTLDDAQVFTTSRLPLASVLFGDDAFSEDGPFLTGPIKDFCDVILVQTWHRYRKGLTREEKVIGKNQVALDAALQEMNDHHPNVPLATLKKYLVLVGKHLTLVQRYKDKATLDAVEEMQKTLKAMYAEALNDDTQMELRQGLPKVFRDAVKNLATPQDIKDIEHLISVAIDNVENEGNIGVVELPEGRELDIAWMEGVENLKNATEDDLWQWLGFADKKIPYFQEFTDPNASIDPWSDIGVKWLADPASTREPLRPRWHQLVGIYRMLELVFDGSPVLLMDGVGIGKTFQVIGLIASLAYYTKYYEKVGKFPGAFVDKRWQGRDGNVPNLPIVISCPVNLHNQWLHELRRFLSPKSFDVLPYLSRLASRKIWWDQVYSKSGQPFSRRIILATESAIQDDSSMMFIDILRDVDGSVKQSPAFSSRAKSTVFGYEYLIAVVDEAHSARKFNKLHTGYQGLRQQAQAILTMTATPVTTKLQDLWIIGVMMGIQAFASKDKYAEMTKELSRAQAKDRKAEKESSDAADRLRSLFGGLSTSQIASTSEFVPKLRRWIPFIRQAFSPYVIRRTLDSVDYAGKKIFGLPPYHIHVLLLELRDWEKTRLRDITAELIDQTPVTTFAGAGKNFYIEFRRGLLHPHMNPKEGEKWITPSSLDHWKANYASTKLDALLEIVTHHLAVDNAPPLLVGPDKKFLIPATQIPDQPSTNDNCDRIVVFSLFPSSNVAIREVLGLRDIKVLEVSGTVPPPKRKTILDEFRTSTKSIGARVLILSMVGTVGLNLACANIMIIADTLWSALDDEQLRGRIYRYPQQKEVHFYRLIASGTPDVFLNNIAFDKGALHEAFVGIDSHSLQLFKGHTHDDDSPSTGIDSDDHEMDVDQPEDVVPTQPVTRNKRGAKKTRAQEAKAPLSPTRPSTKRPAPTSPTISPPVRTKGKSRKQDEGKAKASSTSLTASGSSSVPPPPRPVIPSAPQVASTSAPVTRARERPKPTIRMQKSVAEHVPPPQTSLPPPPFAAGPAPTPSVSKRTSIPEPQHVPPIHRPVISPAQAISTQSPPRQDVVMKDPPPHPPPQPEWDPTTDPILQSMRNDPTWELDPDQLSQCAEKFLSLDPDIPSVPPAAPELSNPSCSSPLSSPPPSPSYPGPSITAGVKLRQNVHVVPTPSTPLPSISQVPPKAGRSNSVPVPRANPPTGPSSETIGGVDLVPGGGGRFRAGMKHGKRKASGKQC